MKFLHHWQIRLMLGILSLSAATSFAGGLPPQTASDRPFATLFISSLCKFHSACELIFDSVDRPDLFESMDSRLKRYNDFAGIDREKPLGIMFAWDQDSTPHIVFLPIVEIEDLMTTATFGVVGFRKVDRDHYEMGRAEKPYQALVRKDYAFIAESASTIHAIRATPDQIIRRLRDQYDLAVHFDLRQIPPSDKRQMVKLVRSTIEPSLQTGDDEAAESGRFRRAVGGLLLDAIDRLAIDTSTVTIGIRVDRDTGHLHLEVVLNAVPKSALANACNRCSPRQSKFSALLRADDGVAAVAVMNLTATRGIVQQVLGVSEKLPVTDSRLDAVMQFVGPRSGQLSLLAAFHGADVKTLNEALPKLLSMASDSGLIENVEQNVNSYLGVNMHSLISPALPKAFTDWMGSGSELILGQASDNLWIGIGSPKNLLDDLEDAIQFVDDSPADRTVVPIVQIQIKGRALPELVASNLVIPNMDTARVREELLRGDDGVMVKVESVTDGIKLSVDFEEGFVRLIGRDWIRQIESFNHE